MKFKRTGVIVIAILVLSSSVAAAWPRPLPHRPVGVHHRHSDRVWVAVGTGILAGTLLSHLFYLPSPPPRAMVYPRRVRVPAPPAYVPVPPPPAYAPALASAQSSDFPQLVEGMVSVNVAVLNVREGPGSQYAVKATVGKGKVLEVLGSAPGWLYVRTPDRAYGWVKAEYTQSAKG